jgi:hypothetical protein
MTRENEQGSWVATVFTPWGIVTSAEVTNLKSAPRKDVLKPAESGIEKKELRMKIALEGITSLVESLPDLTIHAGSSKNWERNWEVDVRRFGKEESLYGLFPKLLSKNTRLLTGTINSLRSSHGHNAPEVFTKSDLIAFDESKLLGVRNMGEKQTEVFRLMKNVIIAERDLQKSE